MKNTWLNNLGVVLVCLAMFFAGYSVTIFTPKSISPTEAELQCEKIVLEKTSKVFKLRDKINKCNNRIVEVAIERNRCMNDLIHHIMKEKNK